MFSVEGFEKYLQTVIQFERDMDRFFRDHIHKEEIREIYKTLGAIHHKRSLQIESLLNRKRISGKELGVKSEKIFSDCNST